MKAFEVKSKLINEIILFFQNYYGLDSKIYLNQNQSQKNQKISQLQQQPYFQYISEHTKEK